jgi:glycosyltransferase involved in cell wall biosynthesis
VAEDKDDFYLTVSRLTPYKRVNLIVEAFSRMPDKRLVVIGDGSQLKSLKAAASKNITILGFQSSDVMHDYMRRARGFVFAAEEDFGICVGEAQACGTPVIAFGKGGVLEIVRGLSESEPTGMFFEEQTAAAIVEAIRNFEQDSTRFDPAACRKNACRFSVERFRRQFTEFCERTVARHKMETAVTTNDAVLSDAIANV